MARVTRAKNGRNITIPVNKLIMVGNDGLWNRASKEVFVTKIMMFVGTTIDDPDDEPYSSDLQIFFKTSTWDIKKHGLIYTEKNFMEEIKSFMLESGVPEDVVSDVQYSEQGMQGTNYVSCDAYEFEKYAKTLFKFPKNPKPAPPPTLTEEFIEAKRMIRVCFNEYKHQQQEKENCRPYIMKILEIQKLAANDLTKKCNQIIVDYKPRFNYTD
ncbi:hypothetical protein BST79_gp303 [Only Syngen Nebraska virus 5]|uniref:hypothetical protein n=1 Tax=Only Syngen Nebraska virus 5 TaxID=1917232 RepID=UPI0009015518|nr:hypothetical protein BST79_gp303 [Only Syngen Nebraska virus 5]APC25816.1 hypothetical protein [Only Syngen Nebraska virus 5]